MKTLVAILLLSGLRGLAQDAYSRQFNLQGYAYLFAGTNHAPAATNYVRLMPHSGFSVSWEARATNDTFTNLTFRLYLSDDGTNYTTYPTHVWSSGLLASNSVFRGRTNFTLDTTDHAKRAGRLEVQNWHTNGLYLTNVVGWVQP